MHAVSAINCQLKNAADLTDLSNAKYNRTLVVNLDFNLRRSMDMPKRTWQPNVRKRLRTHGFRKRMQKPGGRNVLRRRRLKQRTILTVQLTPRKRTH